LFAFYTQRNRSVRMSKRDEKLEKTLEIIKLALTLIWVIGMLYLKRKYIE